MNSVGHVCLSRYAPDEFMSGDVPPDVPFLNIFRLFQPAYGGRLAAMGPQS